MGVLTKAGKPASLETTSDVQTLKNIYASINANRRINVTLSSSSFNQVHRMNPDISNFHSQLIAHSS